MTLGFLFDLDGTVADTDPMHYEAFNNLLVEFGRPRLNHDEYNAQVLGSSNPLIMRTLFPDLPVERHLALADRKELLFRTLSPTMDPLPGLPELLAWGRRHGLPMGAVTNAPRLNAEHTLHAIGAPWLLEGIVIGDEVARPKPDPLPYLTGLARLGIPTDRCVAFEDSRSGLAAASAAGLYVVGLTTSLPAEMVLAHGADRAVADYRDPALLDFLEQALAGGPLTKRPRP